MKRHCFLNRVSGVSDSDKFQRINTQPAGVNTHGDSLNTHGDSLNTHGDSLNTHGDGINRQPVGVSIIGDSPEINRLMLEVPVELQTKILQLKKREHETESLQSLILDVCAIRPMKAEELATLFHKRVDYFRKKYLMPLLEQKKIRYLYPEMIKHPDQAYLTLK